MDDTGRLSDILERVRLLAGIDAVSGQEHALVTYLRDVLAPACDELDVDAVGNLYALRRGPRRGPTVMIAAHTDEIGMVVKSIDERGFLRCTPVGGVLDITLPARLVRVKGHLGVIGAKAGHYQRAGEGRDALASERLYVDVGASSPAEVAALGIEVGSPIAFASEIVRLAGGETLVAGKAIDNRLGCAVLWQVLEAGPPSAGTLVAAFTSQEEVGLKGAAVAGRRIRPDFALALDTMPAGDTPDMDLVNELNVRLGAGPALQVLAGQRGRGFLVSSSVKRYLQRLASRLQVPLQLTAFTGGNNDAAAIAWSGEGVPAAAVCLPRRYSHSPLEVADLRDAEGAYRLLRAVVDDMASLPGFGFLDVD